MHTSVLCIQKNRKKSRSKIRHWRRRHRHCRHHGLAFFIFIYLYVQSIDTSIVLTLFEEKIAQSICQAIYRCSHCDRFSINQSKFANLLVRYRIIDSPIFEKTKEKKRERNR